MKISTIMYYDLKLSQFHQKIARVIFLKFNKDIFWIIGLVITILAIVVTIETITYFLMGVTPEQASFLMIKTAVQCIISFKVVNYLATDKQSILMGIKNGKITAKKLLPGGPSIFVLKTIVFILTMFGLLHVLAMLFLLPLEIRTILEIMVDFIFRLMLIPIPYFMELVIQNANED